MPVELVLAVAATAAVTAGLWLMVDRAAGWAKRWAARRVGVEEGECNARTE